jgi:hypothetical protein
MDRPRRHSWLIALHPAWTISAISGDCGFMKRDASWVFTGIGTLALVVQGIFAFAYRRTECPDGADGEDATSSQDTDSAIREGEPPIVPRSRRKTGK